jgi:hyperosmotically inducible protein
MRFAAVVLIACVVLPTLVVAQKTVSDDTIYDSVRRRLANDTDVKGGALDVSVEKGVVTLRGVLEKEKQKQKAERIASKTKGVTKVINEIRVGPPGAP